MAEYEIKDTGIKNDTETTSAIARISYEIENAKYIDLKNRKIKEQLQELQDKNKFPANLEFIDAFYDKKTSLSGVAFKDISTGKVTVGFAGTNLDNGFWESFQDLKADAQIALNGESASLAYFREGNQFITSLKADGYTVNAITGHSKGGRDGAVLGMVHQIPNIVVYNAAPVNNLLGQGLANVVNPVGVLPRVSNNVEMVTNIKSYRGRLVYINSENDPLSNVAGALYSLYPGEKFILMNGKGHDMVNFLSKDAQQFIQMKLSLVNEKGKVIDSSKAAETLTTYRLQGLQKVRTNLLKNGGGLSSAQEIFLDVSEALVLVQGMHYAIQNELLDLTMVYQKASEEARQIWQNTLSEARDMGTKLSLSEQRNALAHGGATEMIIQNQPIQTYEGKRQKLKKIEKKLNELIHQMKKTIANQIATDQELAQLVRGV
ncbi:hypothetical protein [Enterococcus faecalis]|uniref:hypothetical protein n=1 Tax=Enterococcus faecalis TaxID=1351 RepID=UPI003B9DECAD